MPRTLEYYKGDYGEFRANIRRGYGIGVSPGWTTEGHFKLHLKISKYPAHQELVTFLCENYPTIFTGYVNSVEYQAFRLSDVQAQEMSDPEAREFLNNNKEKTVVKVETEYDGMYCAHIHSTDLKNLEKLFQFIEKKDYYIYTGQNIYNHIGLNQLKEMCRREISENETGLTK